MKSILIGAALAVAFPAVANAQNAPAPAPAAEPKKEMECCEKMKAEGKECCCKDMAKEGHAEQGKASDAKEHAQ